MKRIRDSDQINGFSGLGVLFRSRLPNHRTRELLTDLGCHGLVGFYGDDSPKLRNEVSCHNSSARPQIQSAIPEFLVNFREQTSVEAGGIVRSITLEFFGAMAKSGFKRHQFYRPMTCCTTTTI